MTTNPVQKLKKSGMVYKPGKSPKMIKSTPTMPAPAPAFKKGGMPAKKK